MIAHCSEMKFNKNELNSVNGSRAKILVGKLGVGHKEAHAQDEGEPNNSIVTPQLARKIEGNIYSNPWLANVSECEVAAKRDRENTAEIGKSCVPIVRQ